MIARFFIFYLLLNCQLFLRDGMTHTMEFCQYLAKKLETIFATYSAYSLCALLQYLLAKVHKINRQKMATISEHSCWLGF